MLMELSQEGIFIKLVSCDGFGSLREYTKTAPIHSDQDGFTVDFMKESGVLNKKDSYERSEIHIQRR